LHWSGKVTIATQTSNWRVRLYSVAATSAAGTDLALTPFNSGDSVKAERLLTMDAESARFTEKRQALEQALAENDHERVRALCSELLEAAVEQTPSSDPENDGAVLRARLYQARSVASANLGETEAALKDAERIPERFRDESVGFLCAYLFYRRRQFEAAIKLISSNSAPEDEDTIVHETQRWKLLSAQIAFAREDLDAAAETWRQLIALYSSEKDAAAIWSNWFAVQCIMPEHHYDNDEGAQGIAAIQKAEIYEGFLNVSLWYAVQGKHATSMRWLDEARKLAIAELETDQHDDVARIDVQRAYLFQLQRRDDCARELYERLEACRGSRALLPVDGSTDWVRTFNALILQGNLEELLESDPNSWALTRHQRRLLVWNRAIVSLERGKPQIALEAADDPILNPADRVVLQACALNALGRHQDAEKMLIEQRLYLYAAQMRFQHGDVGAALTLLEQSPSMASTCSSSDEQMKYQPACVLFRAAWYRRQGLVDKAIEALRDAASDALPIRRLRAELLLESRRYQDILESSPEETEKDPVLQLYHLIALSYLDPYAAEQMLPDETKAQIAARAAHEYLRSSQQPASSSDATLQWSTQSQPDVANASGEVFDHVRVTETDRMASCTNQRTRRHGHRKRRNPLPATYRADAPPPDPSRWLPQSQRPGYRRRQRRAAGTGASTSATAAVAADRATQGKLEPAKELDAQDRGPSAASPVPNAPGAAIKLAGKRRVRPTRPKRS
jgi:hypothetical protein